jgi:hypothetical protein
MYQFGTGFLFLSASFDDRNHVFTVRLGVPSKSNTSFPAKDNGLLQQMYDCDPQFNETDGPFKLKITEQALIKHAADNPVAAVQFFKTLFEASEAFPPTITHENHITNAFLQAFLEILLCIPPPSQMNTVPIHHKSRRGLYGIVTDVSLVHETSGRYNNRES